MTTILQAIQAQADAINATAGATVAYTEQRKGLANTPCVIAAPPTLEYAGGHGGTMCGPAVGFRWIALSTYLAPAIEALAELEQLVAHVDAALDVERAEPIQFPRRDPDGKPLPALAAYLITTTDYPL